MRSRFIILTMLLVLAMFASVLPASAQATNFVASIGCDAVALSGTSGVSGTMVVNVTAGATAVVTNSQTPVTSNAVFNVTIPFSVAQVVGTSITVVTTIGTFTDTRTVPCTGNLSGGGDGRLNDLSAPIAVFCANGGVNIINIVNGQGVSNVSANGGQIANGLAQAAQARQNVQIVGSGSTSLWALTSGELQAVFRGNTNYDFIFSPRQCGITVNVITNVIAAPPVVATPGAYPPGYVSGYPPPNSGVYVPPATTSCTAPANTTAAHIVRSGENLFRIGLRYGVDFRIIASFNGITDPARIFVGQCIIIP